MEGAGLVAFVKAALRVDLLHRCHARERPLAYPSSELDPAASKALRMPSLLAAVNAVPSSACALIVFAPGAVSRARSAAKHTGRHRSHRDELDAALRGAPPKSHVLSHRAIW